MYAVICFEGKEMYEIARRKSKEEAIKLAQHLMEGRDDDCLEVMEVD